MPKDAGSGRLESRWDDARAAGMSEPELLLYRSNLLGSDKRITNYGGGNTSAKVIETDPLTREPVEVLWVKGSGGDVGSIKLDGFATLYMEKLEALKGLYRGVEHEDEMVGYLPHCTFRLNPRAASIDTPLHAYVPRAHVDHMHADAIIAVAASANSRELTEKIFGKSIGWLPWKRPGYELGLWLETFCRENPEARGVILESHGLFTWADEAKACYETTLDVINQAIDWLDRETAGKPAFGGPQARAPAARRAPPHRRRADAGDPRHGLQGRPYGRPFRRPAGGAGVRRRPRPRSAGGTRHQLPRPLPAHQDPPAGGGLRPGRPRPRRDARRAAGRGRGLPRRTMPATMSAASMPTARRCATRTRWSSSSPASA